MGKKVSLLVPFLREALKSCKYGAALAYVDQVNEIFEVNLTRKSTSMNKDSVKLLKDWNSIKHREFNFKGNYSVAKQGFLMALKRSKYLKFVPNGKTSIQYRFATKKEIEAKTKSETLQVNVNHSTDDGSTSPIERIISPSFGVEITSSSSSSDVENFNCQSDCTSVILGRRFREFNDQNSQHSFEISHGLQSEETTFLDIFNHSDDRESSAFDARYVSDDQWKEVEEYLYDRKKSKPRGTELQLYRYIDEMNFGKGDVILCELEEDERHSFDLENAEFLKGCPGVIANVDFLKKLLFCHVRIMKLKKGHLLLYLTPISDRVTYTTHVFSDKLIFKNAEYFILYCDTVTTLDQFSPSCHVITK